MPLFEIRGLFDAGVRVSDVSGNEDKYREDLNYGTGMRLFNVDLSLSPNGDGPIDLLEVYANQLGDPFESLGLTLKKHGGFNFRFRRNSSTYFYRDLFLLPEDSDGSKSNGGDFRHFNFDRVNDRVDFDMRVGQRGKVFVGFNRQTRAGDSTVVLDVSRDEFEMGQAVERGEERLHGRFPDRAGQGFRSTSIRPIATTRTTGGRSCQARRSVRSRTTRASSSSTSSYCPSISRCHRRP